MDLNWQVFVAYGTVALILGLVSSPPRLSSYFRISPAGAGASGVAILLIARVVSLGDLAYAVNALWRPLLTLVSVMITTGIAHRLGIIDQAAAWMTRRAGDSTFRLFRSVFMLSAGASAVLNNDAAVLLITPLVVGLVRRRYSDWQVPVVPFAFAVFSGAGVAPLVISNPMNLVVAGYAGITFNEYAWHMMPIAMVGWVLTYWILRLVFKRRLSAAMPDKADALAPAVHVSSATKHFIVLLLASLALYPMISYAGGPVWLVALISAIILTVLGQAHKLAPAGEMLTSVSWDVLIFLICVFVIALGLRNVGLVDRIATIYAVATDSYLKVAVIGASSALGSALLNNHPMAILNALAITSMPGWTQQNVLAALIGGDLGPRILPMGSLAGLLWLNSLRGQQVDISVSEFVAVGSIVTIPTLLTSLGLLLLVG